jgi:hypothetical protein
MTTVLASVLQSDSKVAIDLPVPVLVIDMPVRMTVPLISTAVPDGLSMSTKNEFGRLQVRRPRHFTHPKALALPLPYFILQRLHKVTTIRTLPTRSPFWSRRAMKPSLMASIWIGSSFLTFLNLSTSRNHKSKCHPPTTKGPTPLNSNGSRSALGLPICCHAITKNLKKSLPFHTNLSRITH